MKAVEVLLSKKSYADLLAALPTEILWYDSEKMAHVLYGFDHAAGENWKLLVKIKETE
jgi:hypothetical protein